MSVGTIEMQCADEDFVVREFVLEEVSQVGPNVYVCTHCGWLQHDAASGAAELCRNATWRDAESYQRYALIARAGGHLVPEQPPGFIQTAQASVGSGGGSNNGL